MRDHTTPVTGKGFFLVQRGWRDFEIFKNQPFSEPEAWLYLLETAQYEAGYAPAGGMKIYVERGQLVASYRYLADAWEWKKDRVKDFLMKLKKWGWIDICTDYKEESDSLPTSHGKAYNRRPSLITILKYNELQRSTGSQKAVDSDSEFEKIPTVLSLESDKPKKNQSKKSTKTNQPNRIANQGRDGYLFEHFPSVQEAGEFIFYMPMEWQNYALRKYQSIDWVKEQAEEFWNRYSGGSVTNRNISRLEKRSHWFGVWKKWCDQPFRQLK